MYTITAIAPTVHQLKSVSIFGVPEKQSNGSYKFCAEFNTRTEAEYYLENLAFECFDEEEELNEAMQEIHEFNKLTIDAVTAFIEEVKY